MKKKPKYNFRIDVAISYCDKEDKAAYFFKLYNKEPFLREKQFENCMDMIISDYQKKYHSKYVFIQILNVTPVIADDK